MFLRKWPIVLHFGDNIWKIMLRTGFHMMCWSSNESERHFRSIGAVEIYASGEAIDEGKVLAQILSEIFYQHIELYTRHKRVIHFTFNESKFFWKIYTGRCQRHPF